MVVVKHRNKRSQPYFIIFENVRILYLAITAVNDHLDICKEEFFILSGIKALNENTHIF